MLLLQILTLVLNNILLIFNLDEEILIYIILNGYPLNENASKHPRNAPKEMSLSRLD